MPSFSSETGATLDAETRAPPWNWALPISLSFSVFQALTYTIDLYRQDAKGTRSYLAHLASVSFFPTILAGPITRVETLLDQFEKPKKLDAAMGGRALFLIALGLVKKLLIADYLANNLVNRVFDFPKLYTGAEVLIAVYAYAFQLYYDFSGYTDIALGSAMLLGIKLPINFNRPYAAENIADFWRRWHISLSNWLRDYLYFSLPGKRIKAFAYLNLVITFVIGGLWHGASWNFVIWGALHGFGLAFVRLWQTWRGSAKANGALRYLYIVLTFHYVTFAWIFFRAADFETAWSILQRIGSLTVSFANDAEGAGHHHGDRGAVPLLPEEVVRGQRQSVRPRAVLCAGRSSGAGVWATISRGAGRARCRLFIQISDIRTPEQCCPGRQSSRS